MGFNLDVCHFNHPLTFLTTEKVGYLLLHSTIFPVTNRNYPEVLTYMLIQEAIQQDGGFYALVLYIFIFLIQAFKWEVLGFEQTTFKNLSAHLNNTVSLQSDLYCANHTHAK